MAGITDLIGGLSDDQIESIISNLDDEVIANAVQNGYENYVVPEAKRVREAANEDYEDNEAVAEHYKQLSEDEQEEKFHEALADLLAVLTEVREDPVHGWEELRDRLRSPWTVEAILLIFDHPEVPEEVAEQQKAFARTWLKYAGVHTFPEMYRQEEAREVVERVQPDEMVEAVLEDLDYPHED